FGVGLLLGSVHFRRKSAIENDRQFVEGGFRIGERFAAGSGGVLVDFKGQIADEAGIVFPRQRIVVIRGDRRQPSETASIQSNWILRTVEGRDGLKVPGQTGPD